MSQPTEALKTVGDASAVVITIGTVAQWLPALAALFTAVWTVWRLCEMIEGRLIRNRERNFYLSFLAKEYGGVLEHHHVLPIDELRKIYSISAARRNDETLQK